MRIVKLKSWEEFKTHVGQIYAVPYCNSDDHFFRGMKDARWMLEATLDRGREFRSATQRARYEDQLLLQFRQEIIRLGVAQNDLPVGDALALLARHHGLPSSWIDLTTSPYVAAYFAFSGSSAKSVAVWYLPRAWLPYELDPADLIVDPDLLRFNPRALRQRGIFLRARESSARLMHDLSEGLIKFVLPRSAREEALAELDAMTINAANLFGDYDGAARTAEDRALRQLP